MDFLSISKGTKHQATFCSCLLHLIRISNIFTCTFLLATSGSGRLLPELDHFHWPHSPTKQPPRRTPRELIPYSVVLNGHTKPLYINTLQIRAPLLCIHTKIFRGSRRLRRSADPHTSFRARFLFHPPALRKHSENGIEPLRFAVVFALFLAPTHALF